MIVIPLYVVYSIGLLIFWTATFAVCKLVDKIGRLSFLKSLSNLITSNILLIISFSELGLTIGLMTGSSLSPVVGNVIPGLLTFFGGIVVYVFLTDDNAERKQTREGGLLSIFCISFFLLFGAEISGDLRVDWKEKQRIKDRQRDKDYEVFKNELKKELMEFEYELGKRKEDELLGNDE